MVRIRALVVAALGVIASRCVAQTRYSVSLGNKRLGEARLTQRLTADGGKEVELVMTLKTGTILTEVRSQSSFDRNGRAVRKLMTIGTPGKPYSRQSIATFTADGAHVVIRGGGETKVRDISLVPTAPRNDAAEFWFLRDRPAIGVAVKAYTFNLESLEWELSESRYDAAVGTRHRIVLERAGRRVETVVDDRGEPVTIDDSQGLHLGRLPPSAPGG